MKVIHFQSHLVLTAGSIFEFAQVFGNLHEQKCQTKTQYSKVE